MQKTPYSVIVIVMVTRRQKADLLLEQITDPLTSLG